MLQATADKTLNNGPGGRFPLPYSEELPEAPSAEEMYLANLNTIWIHPNGQAITRESLAEGTFLQPRVLINLKLK